ncbi:MAG: PIN domain-containing protein, partial [Candidatus Kapaibacterium sp.]
MKFFIIDGMALLFRSYYAMMSMPLTSKDGEPTGATFGFISAILRILETEKPDAITVAWDSAEATFRH